MDNKITCLLAHPDDEVIFGFPVLKRAKRIICCSNDSNNPLRVWCKDRKLALKEVGELLGVEIICFDYDSEFYRLPVRDGSLDRMVEEIKACIIKNVPEDEILFTHNAWGEYGHLDHILVNQIARLARRELLTTDIAIYADWFKVQNQFKGEPIMKVQNDLSLYNKCKAIYERFGCWTWSKEPIMEASLREDNIGSV